VFHRSLSPQQGYGFGQVHHPAHYSHVPAPPHSLSPVAMNSARSGTGTGPQRAQPTVVIRSRPSMKLGVSILVAGALLGAVCGVGMRARQNEAAAAFAALAEQEQPAAPAVTSPPPQAPVAPVVIHPNAGPSSAAPQTPLQPPPNAYAGVPFGSLVVSMPPGQPQAAPAAAAAHPIAAAPPAPTVRPVAAGPAAPATKAALQKHAAAWGKPSGGGHPSLSAKVSQPPKDAKDKDDGYKIASAEKDEPAPKPSKAAKAAKEPAPKDEPKETKKAARPSKGSADEADKVLRAAMGATENTL